jgi:hypothetical protein
MSELKCRAAVFALIIRCEMQTNRVARSKTPSVGYEWNSVSDFLPDGYCFEGSTRQNGSPGLAGSLIHSSQAGTKIARCDISCVPVIVYIL